MTDWLCSPGISFAPLGESHERGQMYTQTHGQTLRLLERIGLRANSLKNITLGPGSPGHPGPLLGCCFLSCSLPRCLPCSLPRSLPCPLPSCPLSSLVCLPTLLPEHLGSSLDNCSSSSDHFGLVPLAFRI